MKQIRCNVFETNSSSTHALVLFNEEDYQKFKEGKIVLDDCCKPVELGNLKLKEERDEDDWCPYGAVKEVDGEDYYFTYDMLKDNTELAQENIRSPNGDTIYGVSMYISEG
jgi:hypothetical protein